MFAGVSRPIDPAKKQEASSLTGLRGRLAERLIAVGTGPGLTQVSLGERVLRGALFLKAALWELGQADFVPRLLRTLRRRVQE